MWGIARNHAYSIKTFRLREEWGWAPDLDQLKDVVSSNTRLIAICNSDNPTGYILTADEMEEITAVADRCGPWILADEVYAGAERLQEEQSPSFFWWLRAGDRQRKFEQSLRFAGPAAGLVDKIGARHEYTTLSASMLSNHLGVIALSPKCGPF